MIETLKVGIVGGGIIAGTHVPYIRKAGGRVIGAADVSLVRANELADRFAIRNVYRSVEDLIDAERPDVVHVLTPPHTHAEVAIAALERGVHVLVEKPLANTVEEVEAMTRAAQRAGAVLTVDHNRLFDPVMLEARRLVTEGVLGDLVGVESFQSGNASERPWLDRLPGGGIGDLVPHPLYLQLAFLGRVRDMQVMTSAGGGRLEDVRVLMQGYDGISGVLTISTRAWPHLNILKLYGTRMTVEVNLNNMTLVKRRDYSAPKVVAKSLPNLDEAWTLVKQTAANTTNFLRGRVRYYPGMGILIDRFYAALRSGGSAPVSIAEGAEVVRVTEEIWRQAGGRATTTPLRAAVAAEAGR